MSRYALTFEREPTVPDKLLAVVWEAGKRLDSAWVRSRLEGRRWFADHYAQYNT